MTIYHALVVLATITDPAPPKDSPTDLLLRSWYAWDAVANNPVMDSPDAVFQPSVLDRVVWTVQLTGAVMEYGMRGKRVRIPPELVAAIALRESRLNPRAVYPGCTRTERRRRRQGKRVRCNLDGNPDVGLCQLHTRESWTRISTEEAKLSGPNLMECVRQLRQHYRAHAGHGCTRRVEAGTKGWVVPWGHHSKHNWLQHHNWRSLGHGVRTDRSWRRVRRKVQRRMRELRELRRSRDVPRGTF